MNAYTERKKMNMFFFTLGSFFPIGLWPSCVRYFNIAEQIDNANFELPPNVVFPFLASGAGTYLMLAPEDWVQNFTVGPQNEISCSPLI